jgi:hypothetical protein
MHLEAERSTPAALAMHAGPFKTLGLIAGRSRMQAFADTAVELRTAP